MKITITFALIMLMISSAWCQQKMTGKVFDAYTNTPIEGANILYGNNQGTTTGKDGAFSVPCQNGNSLKITHLSYETWQGTLDSCKADIRIALTPSVLNLNAVEVGGNSSSNANLLEQPQSIALLSRRDLSRNTGVFLEESINLEPGIRMEKRTMSGGQRITIRGYGNNTNFNGMGYKAYINGIPVTDASGTTILDDIDFSTLGKVEVIKGPVSSMYGSGIGGVLNMYTLKPKPQQTSLSQEVVGGSYGLLRTNTRLEAATDKSSILLNYGHQNYDSYRVHSASKKDYLSFVGDFRPNDKQVFSTYLSYNDSYDELAGQLDSIQFFNKKNVGEKNYLDNDGHIGIESYRAGMSHRYQFSKNVANLTSGFVSANVLNQTFAVGLNENSTQNVGGRTEFKFSFIGDKVGVQGIAGSEFQKTNGLYSSYAMSAGIQGGHRSDNAITTMQYNAFTEWSLLLPSAFKVTAGISTNVLEYDINDRLANSSNPTHADASGYKSFDPVLTPRIAVQKVFNKKVSAYAGASKGYSPPTTSEVVIPFTAEVNKGLKPELGTQYEIGTKGNLLNGKLSWQLALFSLQVNDKLSPQSVTDTAGTVLYTYTVNAGNQRNNGLEMACSYTLINDDAKTISYLRPFATFTYSSFSYKSFKSDNNNNVNTKDYSGNTVIGVPPVLLNAGVDMATKWGIYLNTSYQYVDAMYITFDNKHEAPSSALLNGKLGYRKGLGKHFKFDVFAGGNNLTNNLYYNMVFINWERGPQPAIYSPGAYNSTFYGGINVNYLF
jgi:iron complex outermembrane receptor protein